MQLTHDKQFWEKVWSSQLNWPKIALDFKMPPTFIQSPEKSLFVPSHFLEDAKQKLQWPWHSILLFCNHIMTLILAQNFKEAQEFINQLQGITPLWTALDKSSKNTDLSETLSIFSTVAKQSPSDTPTIPIHNIDYWRPVMIHSAKNIFDAYRFTFKKSWYRRLFIPINNNTESEKELAYLLRIRKIVSEHDALADRRWLLWHRFKGWIHNIRDKRRLISLYNLSKTIQDWSTAETLPSDIDVSNVVISCHDLGMTKYSKHLKRLMLIQLQQQGDEMRRRVNDNKTIGMSNEEHRDPNMRENRKNNYESAYRSNALATLTRAFQSSDADNDWDEGKVSEPLDELLKLFKTQIENQNLPEDNRLDALQRLLTIHHKFQSVLFKLVRFRHLWQFYRRFTRDIQNIAADASTLSLDYLLKMYANQEKKLTGTINSKFDTAMSEGREALMDEDFHRQLIRLVSKVWGTQTEHYFKARMNLESQLALRLRAFSKTKSKELSKKFKKSPSKFNEYYNHLLPELANLQERLNVIRPFSASFVEARQNIFETMNLLQSTAVGVEPQILSINNFKQDIKKWNETWESGLNKVYSQNSKWLNSAETSEKLRNSLSSISQSNNASSTNANLSTSSEANKVLNNYILYGLRALSETWDLFKKSAQGFPQPDDSFNIRLSAEVLPPFFYRKNMEKKDERDEETEHWLYHNRPQNHYVFHYLPHEQSWVASGRDSKGEIRRTKLKLKHLSDSWHDQINKLEAQPDMQTTLCYPLLKALSSKLNEKLFELIHTIESKNEILPSVSKDYQAIIEAVYKNNYLPAMKRRSKLAALIYDLRNFILDLLQKCNDRSIHKAVFTLIYNTHEEFFDRPIAELDRPHQKNNECRAIIPYHPPLELTSDEVFDQNFFYSCQGFELAHYEFKWLLHTKIQALRNPNIDEWINAILNDEALSTAFARLKRVYKTIIYHAHSDRLNIVLKDIDPRAIKTETRIINQYAENIKKKYDSFKDLIPANPSSLDNETIKATYQSGLEKYLGFIYFPFLVFRPTSISDEDRHSQTNYAENRRNNFTLRRLKNDLRKIDELSENSKILEMKIKKADERTKAAEAENNMLRTEAVTLRTEAATLRTETEAANTRAETAEAKMKLLEEKLAALEAQSQNTIVNANEDRTPNATGRHSPALFSAVAGDRTSCEINTAENGFNLIEFAGI